MALRRGDVVDFDHAEHVLGREIGQSPRFFLRLGNRVLARCPFVEAEQRRHQKNQSGV